jgi:hypothetical protein
MNPSPGVKRLTAMHRGRRWAKVDRVNPRVGDMLPDTPSGRIAVPESCTQRRLP